MSEAMIIPAVIGIILACAGVSFWIGRVLARRRDFRTRKRDFLIASLAPTLLISAGIIVWQMIDQTGMTAEQRESYMGPALLFLYGAPWFAANLVVNTLAAIAGLNRLKAD